jgi:predicted aldo/keto reductase-like oxidoreductase
MPHVIVKLNFFDTANVYASGTSEEIIGRALKDFANRMRSSSLPRCTAKCTTDRMAPGYRARQS